MSHPEFISIVLLEGLPQERGRLRIASGFSFKTSYSKFLSKEARRNLSQSEVALSLSLATKQELNFRTIP